MRPIEGIMKKEKVKVFSLRLTEALHTEMRVHVASNRTSIQQWLLKLIQDDLKKKK